MKVLLTIAGLWAITFTLFAFGSTANILPHIGGVITGVFSMWLTIAFLISVTEHLSDLGKLAASDVKIETAEQVLTGAKDLTADGTGLPEQLLALQQDNNPVTKYMNIVNNAAQQVQYAKNSQADTKARIAVRAAGPFAVVVTWFGSTT